MGNSGRLIYASPDRRTQSSPKQLSWRKESYASLENKGYGYPLGCANDSRRKREVNSS